MVHNAVFVVGAVVGAVMVIAGGVFFPVFDKIIHDEVVKVSLFDKSIRSPPTPSSAFLISSFQIPNTKFPGKELSKFHIFFRPVTQAVIH